MKNKSKISQKVFTLLITLAICLISIPMALAEDTQTNYNEMFETTTVDGGVQINGFTEEYVLSRQDDTTANVVIPAQIDGKEVVAFEAYAFCDDPLDENDAATLAPDLIKEINISEKCTSIGASAFRGCANLTTLNLPVKSDGLYFGTYSFAGSGVTEFTFYEYMSFAGVVDGSVLTADSGFIFQSSDVATINFPDTWSDEAGLMISAYMFNGCPITELNLPSYLSEVGKMAFMNCSSLTDLNWPDSCSINTGMKFAGSVFMGCGFDVMTLPQYVSQMSDNAFFCVETLYLPENPINHFNTYAFANKADLTVVATSKDTYKIWDEYDFEDSFGVLDSNFSYEFNIQFINDENTVVKTEPKLYNQQIDYVKGDDNSWKRSGSYEFPENTGDNIGWASEKNSVKIPYVHMYSCIADTYYEAASQENTYMWLGSYPQSYVDEGNIQGSPDDSVADYSKIVPDDTESKFVIVQNTPIWAASFRCDDIKWLILDKIDNKDGTYTYSLVSDLILHGKKFDSNYVTWKDSEIREWLNGEDTVSAALDGYDNVLLADPNAYDISATSFDDEFYGSAFVDWEKDLINSTVINGLFYREPTATSTDKIYLMSAFEAEYYFPTAEMKIAKYSSYGNREVNGRMSYGASGSWFARTTYTLSGEECPLYYNSIGKFLYLTGHKKYGIRPAMTVTVTDDYNTTGTGTSNDPFRIVPIPTYTVTYDGNGAVGSTEDTNKYKEDADVTILANNFTKEDCYFTGWNTKADGTGTTYAADDTYTMETEDITLYAQWASCCKLTYHANGGTGSVIDDGEYKCLDVVDIAENSFVAPVDKHFVSWNTEADGSGSTYFPEGTYTFMYDDFDLYAIWAGDELEDEPTGNDLDADGTHTEYLGDHVKDDMKKFPHPTDFGVVDKDTGDELSEGTDYEVTLHTHLPGHTLADVEGIGDYAGDSDKVDYIIRQDISDYNNDGRGGIDNSIFYGNIQHQYEYTGDEIKPIDFVTSIIGQLKEGEDYTLTYEEVSSPTPAPAPAPASRAVAMMASINELQTLDVANANNLNGITRVAAGGTNMSSVGLKRATITGIGDVFYGQIVVEYEVVAPAAIIGHEHTMDYQEFFVYDGSSLKTDMLDTIEVSETESGVTAVLDSSKYTVTFDSTEAGYTTHPGYVKFTVQVNGCSHKLYGVMMIRKDITNAAVDDYIGGVDNTVYIMDDSIEEDFKGDYTDIKNLYLMDQESYGYFRLLNKYTDSASYSNFKVYRDGDNIIFDADFNDDMDGGDYDCFYGKITIHMPEPKKPSGGSSGGGSSKPKPEVKPETPTLNKDDHFAYMQGYPDETFRASNNITRAETVVMFARLLSEKMEENKIYTSSFLDITGNEWFANQVGYMEKFGVVNGYEDSTFGGNDYITRAEFATIASRFDELAETDKNVFSDVLAENWAADYINSAAEKGWINGYSDGTFKPNQNITRAEAVTLVNRVLERVCDEDYADENINKLVEFVDLNDSHWAYYDIVEATNAHDYTKEYDEDKDKYGDENWTKIYAND